MFDRSLVTSGFDTETLVSERYLAYILLAQVEAGLLPLEFDVVDAALGLDLTVRIHPPADYDRLYERHPAAVLPDSNGQSFDIRLLPDNNAPIEAVAFSPDGQTVASGAWDGAVRLWATDTGLQTAVLEGTIGEISCLAYSPDGSRLASGATDRLIRVWDIATGQEEKVLFGANSLIHSVAFHPDGVRLASGSFDDLVRLWDVDLGVVLSAFVGHSGPVRGIAFSPDGTRIASCSDDETVRLWDLASGDELQVFGGHSSRVRSVAYSPDGSRLASASEDGTIRVWDIQSGTQERNINPEDGPVWSVAFSPDGAHILAGYDDNTVRRWNAQSGAAVDTLSCEPNPCGHDGPVRSVVYSSDGAHIASGSYDTDVRLWDASGGDFLRKITVEFMRLTLFVSVFDNNAGSDLTPGPSPVLLNINLQLRFDRSGRLETNHRLSLSLSRLDPSTVNLLTTFGVPAPAVAEIEAAVRRQLDRNIPLGVAQGQRVQQIRMHKLISDSQRTLGFYVDLALRNGPEASDLHPPRGSLFFPQDFRDPAMHIAFATSPDFFALAGPDFKFRQAEKKDDGTFRFPLREDPMNPDSETIGTVKGVKIGPELQSGLPTGRLEVDLHGEYTATNNDGDPDFHLLLWLDPKQKGNQVDPNDNDSLTGALVEWDLDVDVRFGLLATIFLVGVGILLTALFGPAGLGFTGTVLTGLVIGIAVLKELIAEPLAAKIIQDRLEEEEVDASFLDALPFRIPAATQRWDPFYAMQHQVVGLVDDVVVDLQGIAFEAQGLALDKQPVLRNDVTIREEIRAADSSITALRYCVSDFPNIANGLAATGPGQDRMDYTRDDAANEPKLVTLTLAQIAERIEAERILAPISFTAERIQLVDNQIDNLLLISHHEKTRVREDFVETFKCKTRAQIAADDGDDIESEATNDLEQQLGRPPTDKEVEDEVSERLDALVAESLAEFKEGDFSECLSFFTGHVLNFDLAPEEMVALQRAGILLLDGKVIITRENEDGTTTDYYRDYADADPRDNLLSLMTYIPPYEPEEPPQECAFLFEDDDCLVKNERERCR